MRAYIYRFRLDHSLEKGTRNTSLWALRVWLQRKNNMWDDVAQAQFRDLALSSGLTAREVNQIMGANIDGASPLDKSAVGGTRGAQSLTTQGPAGRAVCKQKSPAEKEAGPQ